ncbi:tRNA pseudouridine(38-40) synthase TruA [Capnocytophaga cynodegmi]|uniref:tRNA pseudouridine synthase A n=1 Tax=Capnocytophaga cynodegmi TaxID=28189 RepID=A0A0B7HJP9_9FLAO|nr:tRNA pseudouridine(38-40) synthase TruA [Capnocytophaga cynodegmi]CEN34765.1 tRNA pseudouridine synthase A [Capnocytophaga cynodegmi]CEN38884.1 tRNA pseudouridine synthase A [Capnocytophaga cynodegmi]
MRYFIEFSYNGKNYHGWQNQPHSVSVQEVMEKCLTALLRTKIEIVGAGRTDSGVHALQMFAHFDTEKTIDNQLVYKLNSFLPKDIAVHQIHKVRDDAHARFDAIKRTYEYHISTYKDVFRYESSMYINLPLDVQKMQEAANILFKYADFQCFSKSNTDVRTYNCKIYRALWRQEGELLIFTISADRFLRNMVRAIVGTLIEVGLNKISVIDFQNIIESKNRSKAGASVPACGLFLKKVEYSEDIFVKND